MRLPTALACLLLTVALAGAGPPAPEFPRVPPKEPADALKTFRTRDGFRMELVAHEPLVTSPVAVAYDENGLAYVLEMRDYPYTDRALDKAWAEQQSPPIGRIRVLRDSRGDGVYDQSVVFADNLSWPTGIAFWKGGVFVAATPDLWYFKDTDGDLKADVRQKVYTGFRKFNVQAVINNLQWGLDHRVYGAGGTNGGRIQNLRNPATAPVSMSVNDFRFDPVTGRFEAISGGARFGNTFDDWGNRFICNIRNPVQHVVLPSWYLARNPFAPVRSAVNDAAASGDTLRVYRASPPEAWRAFRAERWTAEGARYPRSELVAEGYFTSACGVTVYRGAAYPPRYYGNAFVAEPAGNLVHRETVRPEGATFTARRADPETEFVASTDNWFRPVNFTNAPDGTLHVVDMYRETIEHPWSIPDDIKARLDLTSGRDRGRIYRLAPPGFRPPPPPRLGRASTATLVACLENSNAWWRETAHRLLYERQDRAAIRPLRELARHSKSPLARLHALWSLDGLGAMEEDDVAACLADAAEGIRENAVRLAEPRLRTSPRLRDKVLALADDPSARVRLQVVFTLGEVTDDRAPAALAAIARRDAGDEWVREAILSSAVERSDRLLVLLAAAGRLASAPAGRVLAHQLARVVGARARGPEIRRALAARAWQNEIVLGIGEGLKGAGRSLHGAVRGTDAEPRVRALLDAARRTAADDAAPPERREQAIQLLALGDFDAARDALAAALDTRQPPGVQMAAVRALSGFRDARVGGMLLQGWRTYTPAVRGEVVEALLARADRLGPLLDAVQSGAVGVGQISPARRTLLMKHPDPAVRRRAEALFRGGIPGQRAQVIAQYQKALAGRANPRRGRLVFERECTACHRLGDKGHEVGPNLETMRGHAPGEVLVHVLDPNREVAPNFMEYVVATTDGRSATGVIAAETATSLTLRRAEGVQETFLRQNIDAISSTGASLMPEGLEKKITPPEMADLIAYLLHPTEGRP